MLPFESDLLGLNKELRVQDVFAANTYTGNSTSNTVVNGINLPAYGGLVWMKSRSASQSHMLMDTLRSSVLSSDTTNAEGGVPGNYITSYNPNGYTTGPISSGNGTTYVGWTFRRARKFFDIVTYIGNGVAGRQIAHGLGVVPGMIVTKARSGGSPWRCYHRSQGATQMLVLNSTANAEAGQTYWNNTEPTASSFTVGTDGAMNAAGSTYVAYLFAHDPSEKGFIQCGSYTGNGSTIGASVSLGWRPQYILIKPSNNDGGWSIFDSSRGISSGNEAVLLANSSAAETSNQRLDVTNDGFSLNATVSEVNSSGITYIYMAIREPYVKQPVDEVFETNTWTGNSGTKTITNFLDYAGKGGLIWSKPRNTADSHRLIDTVRGGLNTLSSDTTTQAITDQGLITFGPTGFDLGSNSVVNGSGRTHVGWSFLRKPGFFDIVTYTGNGVAGRQIPHNLGAVPGMIIIKRRDSGSNWISWHNSLSSTEYLQLNSTSGKTVGSTAAWNSTLPSTFNFTLGTFSDVNFNGSTYVAYIFGHDTSADGLIQCGTYVGDGNTTGPLVNLGWKPQYVLIKYASGSGSGGTGPWIIYDTQRVTETLQAETSDRANTSNTPIYSASGFRPLFDSSVNPNNFQSTYIYMAIRAGSYS